MGRERAHLVQALLWSGFSLERRGRRAKVSYQGSHAFGCPGRDCTGCPCQSKALGGFGPWRQLQVEDDEVYLWRGKVTGVPLTSRADLKTVAIALAKAIRGMGFFDPTGVVESLLFTLRGITVKEEDGGFWLDGAMTSNVDQLLGGGGLVFSDAEDVGADLAKNLQATWHAARVSSPSLLVIDDDAPKHPALDFWRSHAPIWDPTLGGGLIPKGGPTQSLDRFEGLYRGTADQGINLKPWAPPGSGPPGAKPQTTGTGGSPLPGVIAVVAVVGGLYWLSTRGDTKSDKGAALT